MVLEQFWPLFEARDFDQKLQLLHKSLAPFSGAPRYVLPEAAKPRNGYAAYAHAAPDKSVRTHPEGAERGGSCGDCKKQRQPFKATYRGEQSIQILQNTRNNDQCTTKCHWNFAIIPSSRNARINPISPQ